MEFKDEMAKEDWAKQKEMVAGDFYTTATANYAEAWANLMEERMKDGAPLTDVAKQASFDSDKEGVTGYMYGCAARMLAAYWKYGEEFRLWFNLDCSPKQGAEVNAKPGVILNPAILTITPRGE